MDWPTDIDHLLHPPGAAAGTLADLDRLLTKDEPDPTSGPLDIYGLEGGSPGLVLARAASARKRPMLVITDTPTAAEQIIDDIEFHLGRDSGVATSLFPAFAHLPFGRMMAHPWTVARRIRTLWRLLNENRPVVAAAPIQAVVHRLIPKAALTGFAELLLEGEEIDREAFIAKMISGGYNPTALVEEPGDIAVRGGIIDIFGPLNDEPVRLEFFGDYVDSLRLFHPHDQRSSGRLSEAVLPPMSEVILDPSGLEAGRSGLARLEADPTAIMALREPLREGLPFAGIESYLPLFHEKTAWLSDYLPEGGLTVLLEPAAVERAAKAYLSDLDNRISELKTTGRPVLARREITADWPGLSRTLAKTGRVNIRGLKLRHGEQSPQIDFRGGRTGELIRHDPEAPSVLSPLIGAVRRLGEEGFAVWLVCRTEGQMGRLAELLANHGLKAASWPPPPEQGDPVEPRPDLRLCRGALSAGFVLPGLRLVVLTEEEALGQMKVKGAGRSRSKTPAAALASYAELSPGDLVVHEDHGIGKFEALVHLTVDGRTGDYLLIYYKNKDKLYLPADRLGLIQKYIGPEGKKPPLDRLGGATWQATKSRVRQKLMEIAQELIDLYAVRQVAEGHAYTGRDGTLREFESTFGFEETPDQIKAIDDVIDDMGRARPMDRLVCGDVGYGKTEVALRAAFRAVMDGRQVALLVPTTVLAEQHAETFMQRMAPYPINVASLSRFKTAKEQKQVLEELASGVMDIVIGTHRLLSKDVRFARLGLVIVDEEHRFGVSHKERLKEMRKTVDVLALTATPIPRTLQMSLFNIRDLSVIDTPPRDRQAITTYLSRFDPAAIQEAIGRELGRGGQVFFVHNRVKDILKIANFVQKLGPTARVDVAHGQMSERALEKVMMRFVRGELDVLVCTTIIESGLDIPSANTIIINNADKLGLAQIYQLRGRVGRGSERAYAYLLIPEETTLSRDAQKRLKVMMDFTHLGAGFKIAMHDLQIRGGGNMLGKAQSGQMGAVGYEMYLTLMEEAVAELNGRPPEERIDPEINRNLDAFVPEDYVPDANMRLLLYRRLAGVSGEEALEDLLTEIRDRFGPPPAELFNLADTIRLKLDLKQAGVVRLDAEAGTAVLTFSEKTPINPAALVAYVRSAPKRLKMTGGNRLLIRAKNPIAETKKILAALVKAC